MYAICFRHTEVNDYNKGLRPVLGCSAPINKHEMAVKILESNGFVKTEVEDIFQTKPTEGVALISAKIIPVTKTDSLEGWIKKIQKEGPPHDLFNQEYIDCQ